MERILDAVLPLFDLYLGNATDLYYGNASGVERTYSASEPAYLPTPRDVLNLAVRLAAVGVDRCSISRQLARKTGSLRCCGTHRPSGQPKTALSEGSAAATEFGTRLDSFRAQSADAAKTQEAAKWGIER